ncbi:MAG: redox-regulated ATPase YchF [Candidatus Aenigmarchaeota archaeon]|nr:redox-regulated ATPase YchF [Candidatus Aenigmarchaeota archaeon]
MMIGVVGKSNVGKTTFFSAATLVDAEISNRIFTTIAPNKGVTYVRARCACQDLKVKCNPQNSKCVNGVRYVPIKMTDVAGLVPGAHLGKGLGNQFLSDIMEANALIHVVDISGGTDETGNSVKPGTRDPKEDIKFLEEEIDYWILGIIKRNLSTLLRKMESTKEKFSVIMQQQLAGLGIKLAEVEDAMNKTELAQNADELTLLDFIKILREKSKPIVIAANKIDVRESDANYQRLKDIGYSLIPCSAESELALRKASDHGLISYMPGDSDFSVISDIDEKKKLALNFIRNNVLQKYGSTGVQKIVDKIVFEILEMIVVYPVENEHKFTDHKGNALPDALLMKKGSTALDLAFAVHEDIGKKFVAAVDARSGKHVSSGYILKNGDVISIKAAR